MDERNDINSPDGQNEPLEIPSNNPQSETQPIKALSNENDKKRRKKMNTIKIAYGLAILVALGGAITARLATEDALEDMKATFPDDSITLPATPGTTSFNYNIITEEPDFEVRQNVTDVPDTREETEEQTTNVSTEKETESTIKYAAPYKDYYTLPIGTDISKDYSPKTPIYNATMGNWRTHTGIDFSGTDGAQVKAISNGKVTRVYEDTLYGTVVEIDHGNEVIAKYCGLNAEALEIKTGDTVKNGELIGYLGTVPCEKAESSHLHFEIIYKGANVDPLELMGK